MSGGLPRRLLPSRCAQQGAWLAALLCLAACGATPTATPDAPPTVERTARADAKALGSGPVVLRYNPAPCACPAFEARSAGGWLRAELDLQAVPEAEAWLAHLARLGDEQLPVPVQADATGDGELYRTWQGVWTVRLTVQRVVAPLVPPAAPEPAPAAGEPAAQPASAPADPANAAPPAPAGDEAPKRPQR